MIQKFYSLTKVCLYIFLGAQEISFNISFSGLHNSLEPFLGQEAKTLGSFLAFYIGIHRQKIIQ